VIDVARELDIEEQYVETAIDELRASRAPPEPEPEPPTVAVPVQGPGARVLWLLPPLALLLLLSGLVAGVFLLAGQDAEPEVPEVVKPAPVRPTPPPVKVKKPAPEPPPPPAPAPAQMTEPAPEPVQAPEEPEAAVVPTPPEPPLPLPRPSRKLARALAGDWILVSYHLKDEGAFFEVPLTSSRSKSAPERWHFRADGTFRHVMADTLVFSGNWQVARWKLEDLWTDAVPKGTPILISGLKVRSNIPGIQRAEEHYWGVFNDERLVLYFLGETQKPKKLPTQGHGFRKSWKGGWTW